MFVKDESAKELGTSRASMHRKEYTTTTTSTKISIPEKLKHIYIYVLFSWKCVECPKIDGMLYIEYYYHYFSL